MQYVLLAVVVLFIIFTAWRDREARLERAEVARGATRERQELLTRITHPDLVVVPDIPPEDRREILPDADLEDDDFNMVGTIVPGLPE